MKCFDHHIKDLTFKDEVDGEIREVSQGITLWINTKTRNQIMDTITLHQYQKYGYKIGNITESIIFTDTKCTFSKLILKEYKMRATTKKLMKAEDPIKKSAY